MPRGSMPATPAAAAVRCTSRIAGTGSYLPADGPDQRRAGDSASTPATSGSARAPASAQRHIAADGETTSDLALRAARAGAGGGRHRRRPTSTSSSSRPPRPDMIFPSHRVHPAGQAGRRAAAPAFDVQAVCSGFVYALAIADQMVSERAPHATRWWSAPRSIRASSTGTTAAPACCSATAPARSCSCRRDSRASSSTHLHADGSHREHPVRAGHGAQRRASTGTPFLHMDGTAVFKFAVKVLAEVARRGAGRRRHAGRATSTG